MRSRRVWIPRCSFRPSGADTSTFATGDDASGIPPSTLLGSRFPPVLYVLRHTFASSALAAGVGTFELARYMGTSVEMIERTYGHLVTGADEAFRARLDAFGAERSGVDVASSAES